MRDVKRFEARWLVHGNRNGGGLSIGLVFHYPVRVIDDEIIPVMGYSQVRVVLGLGYASLSISFNYGINTYR